MREGTEQAVYVSTVVLYGGYRKAGNSSSHAGQPLPHDLAVVKLQPTLHHQIFRVSDVLDSHKSGFFSRFRKNSS